MEIIGNILLSGTASAGNAISISTASLPIAICEFNVTVRPATDDPLNVVERLNSGKFVTREKLQCCSATGGNV